MKNIGCAFGTSLFFGWFVFIAFKKVYSIANYSLLIASWKRRNIDFFCIYLKVVLKMCVLYLKVIHKMCNT